MVMFVNPVRLTWVHKRLLDTSQKLVLAVNYSARYYAYKMKTIPTGRKHTTLHCVSKKGTPTLSTVTLERINRF